jgi:polysaccharide export outer membrane protein
MRNHSDINKNSGFILLLSLIIIFSSCITNRDLEYVRSNKGMSNTQVTLEDYKLQPGDLLSVQISTTTEQQHDFFNKENTSNSQLMLQNPYLYGYLIKEDGTLDLPSFGILKAAGFTLAELESVIKNIATSYFESPVVKLNIINFQITILGEVNDPGTFKIVDPKVNILYALSLAGDMTQFGDRKKVKIIRNEDNLNRVFYINLTQKDILNDNAFMLKPNDIIYVSPIKDNLFSSINNLTSIVSISISAVTLFLLINQN